MERESRYLECIGSDTIGRDVFMEIAGEEPLLPERREIAVKGRILEADYVRDNKTITIQIPLENLKTISLTPISSAQREKENAS